MYHVISLCRVTRAIVKKLPLEKSSVDVTVTAKILNGELLYIIVVRVKCDFMGLCPAAY